jgi:hypothetical protein
MTFPADPAESPAWASEETWAKMRHDEPHTCAFWTVTLSCGHAAEVPVSDLGWKPADGPRLVSASRLRKIKADFEELRESQPDAQEPREREHMRRMIAVRWPSPEPEELCWTCPWAQAITACQRTGWLIPRPAEPTPAKPPKPPSRASLQRRLREAEAQAGELRRQLAQLEAPAEQEQDS